MQNTKKILLFLNILKNILPIKNNPWSKTFKKSNSSKISLFSPQKILHKNSLFSYFNRKIYFKTEIRKPCISLCITRFYKKFSQNLREFFVFEGKIFLKNNEVLKKICHSELVEESKKSWKKIQNFQSIYFVRKLFKTFS